MWNAERDENNVPTILWVSKDDSSVVVPIKVNPVTWRLLTEIVWWGSWDVVWPAVAVDENIAVYDWTTGKLIKDWWSTKAQILDRANHTWTQTASTISDFDTQVASTALLKASNLSDLPDIPTAKTNLSLQNVDNTSDATKNSAVATLTNKTLTSPVVNTPTWIVKWDVWLWNVDNTTDANKPVSTAQQTALDAKVDENWAITWATKTKITYDAKGLVTTWVDATTADIAASTNKNYVTDAELVVIWNTSNTNTWDEIVAIWSELDTWTNDVKYASSKAIKDSKNVPSVVPWADWNVLTSDWTDWVSETPAWWGWPLYWDWVVVLDAGLADRTWTVVGEYARIVNLEFGDAVDWEEGVFTARVPEWKTSISSIKVVYIDNTASSLNLYLQFRTWHMTTTGRESDVTDTFSTYASAGVNDSLQKITVPSSAYNWLTSIVAWNRIWLEMIRNWNHASDTYWTTFRVIAVEFTFA